MIRSFSSLFRCIIPCSFLAIGVAAAGCGDSESSGGTGSGGSGGESDATSSANTTATGAGGATTASGTGGAGGATSTSAATTTTGAGGTGGGSAGPYICDGANSADQVIDDTQQTSAMGPLIAVAWTPAVTGTITRLELFTGESTGQSAVGVWSGGGNPAAPAQALAYSLPFTMMQTNSWQGADLTTPLSVQQGQPLWVVWQAPMGGSQAPVGGANPVGDIYYFSLSGDVTGGATWVGPTGPDPTVAHKFRLYCAP